MGGRDVDGDSNTDITITYDHVGNIRTVTDNGTTTTYTHDGWNRLVQVDVGSTTYGEYEYNGLHHRTVKRSIEGIAFMGFNRQRYYTYSTEWQILEEHADDDFDNTTEEYIESFWGIGGLDDIVRRRVNDDFTNDSPDVTYEKSFYHLTDTNFSTLAITNDAGVIQERVTYSPHGVARHRWFNDVDGDGDYDSTDRNAIVTLTITPGGTIGQPGYNVDCDLDLDGDVDFTDVNLATTSYKAALAPGDLSSNEVNNQYGYAGYIFEPAFQYYLTRNRWYDPELGRWLQRDPADYVDGLTGSYSGIECRTKSAQPA